MSTSPSESLRSSLLSLSDSMDTFALSWPGLHAVVWFDTTKKTLGIIPTPFRPLSSTDFQRDVVSNFATMPGWQVMLTLDRASRSSRTELISERSRSQFDQLARRFSRLLDSDPLRRPPPSDLDCLLMLLSQCQWVEAYGQHAGHPGVWIGRDGCPNVFVNEVTAEQMWGAPTTMPSAWCARIKNVFASLAEWARRMAEGSDPIPSLKPNTSSIQPEDIPDPSLVIVTEPPIADGFHGVSKFTYRGVEVDLGSAKLLRKILAALWDDKRACPRHARSRRTVIEEVWGNVNAVHVPDNTFSRRLSEIRVRFQQRNLPLDIVNENDLVELVPQ